MLPGIRTVLFAVIAAIGLLVGAFALAAMLRVAQERRSGPLQAYLAQRTRTLVAADSEPRAVAPLERLSPLEPNPVAPVEARDAPDIGPPVVAGATQAEPPAIDLPFVMPPLAGVARTEPPPAGPQRADPIAELLRAELPAEPPIGGPLPEQAAAVHAEPPPHHAADRTAAKKKAKQEAARKARDARLARIARARKAAARKARAARAAQQAAAPANNSSFGSFGNFNSFGSRPFGQ